MNNKWEELCHYLLEGDEEKAYNLLLAEDLDSINIYNDLITKAMQHVGYLWETNQITVADEHLATSICDFIITRYAFSRKGSVHHQHGKKMMFLCLEQEQHILGAKMAAALATEKGWNVRQLGADLPLEYTIDSAKKWQPEVIGLSAALPYRLTTLSDYVIELEKLSWKPKIVIGGRLASMYDLRSYCGNKSTIFTNLYELNDWLDKEQGCVNVDGAS
ncbi:methyltransferase cognate corrinoid proteins [Oceanobacillus picturae]|uniref:Methyltransferase cognate corrinoid proteins n=1 Tax=Oceanobacillus picturae TaxID=171693 RepID=W9AAG5_9BACI|nr:cobalamin-dependent protein [Oceanobacillus picturae]RIU90000.1 cobalamin-binding protein [Oceanobacillus picturae]GAQ19685.1 methyltransferase cognate corrinoid proteins [Oceanobacillus picturae]CDO02488.1 methyltransferase cognate corrinoid proteins, Methanosarcina family [Oceanobacillus picturae]